MKKIIFLTLLLSQFCFASFDSGGGMDGGGGGTLPAQPTPKYMIQDIANSSKPKILFLLNKYEADYEPTSTIYQKLFNGPRKAQEVLNDLRLEVRTEEPCYTSNHTEVDASIYGAKPNTICLSAQRISPKLDQSVAQREILALLMHEVSHYMGTTEEEATKLQKDIAWEITKSTSKIDINTNEIRDSGNDTLRYIYESREFSLTTNNNLSEANNQLEKALFNFTKLQSLANNPLYNVFNIRENDYQSLLKEKLNQANIFLKTQMQNDEQDYYKKQYNNTFKDKDFILLEDTIGKSNLYAKEKIFKLNSISELFQLLVNIETDFRIRDMFIYQATEGVNWVNLNGHLTKNLDNPWLSFQGEYVIDNTQCIENNDSYLNLKSVKIYTENDTLYIREQILNSNSSGPLILGGNFDSNYSLNDWGTNSDNSVYMKLARGGSWSDQSYSDLFTSTRTLKKTSATTFEMTIVKQVKRNNPSLPDSQWSCKFTGHYQ